MARETHLPVLFQLFRQYGYDGVSLSKIAATTELGKASLYHHFPGGKAEMVVAALAYGSFWMEENVFSTLRSPGEVLSKFEKMCDRLCELYDSGESPSLLAALIAGGKRDVFAEQIEGHLRKWIDAIAQVLIEAGVEPATAQQKGEDAVVSIQGALIVSRGMGDVAVFKRAIACIPAALCEGIDS